jgi:hypothetical protein
MQIITVGLALAKRIFQVHAVDATGSVVVRKALRRWQVLPVLHQAGGLSDRHGGLRELASLGATTSPPT